MAKVFLDPGHGGNDPGASGNGLLEKNVNLSVALMVKSLLERHGVTVYMSRTGDSNPSLNQRTNDANNVKADILLSIHCNAFNQSAYGVETYCYKFKYRKLADCIQNEIISAGLYNYNRGVKEGNLHMVRESNMDAALVEMAFIDNANDAKLLANKQSEFAEALTKGLLRYLGIAWNGSSAPSVPTPPTPPAPTPKPSIDVFYKAYANGVWYPEVKNLTDYAGVFGKDIECIMVRPGSGIVEYRVSPLNSNYYPWVRNYSDYAGLAGKNIDKVQMRLINMPGYDIKYRVRLLNGSWLPWVINDSDYAGIPGRCIDAFEVQIISK